MITPPSIEHSFSSADKVVPGVNDTDKQRWLRTWEESGVKTTNAEDFEQNVQQKAHDEQSDNSASSKSEVIKISATESMPSRGNIINSVHNDAKIDVFSDPLASKVRAASGEKSVNSVAGQYLVGKYVDSKIATRVSTTTDSNARLMLIESQIRRWYPETNIHVRQGDNKVDITIRDFVNRDYRLEKVVSRIKSFMTANKTSIGVLTINGVKQTN